MALHSLLGSPVVAVGLLSAVAFVVFRTLGAVVGDGDGAIRRIRRLARIGLPVAFGVAFVVLIVVDLLDLVDAGLRTIDPSLVGSSIDSVVSLLVIGTACALVVTSAYLGLWSTISRVRETPMDAPTAARRIFRYVMVLVVSFVVLFETAALATNGGAWLVGVAIAAGVVVLVAAQPHIVRLQHPTREPTNGERERLDSLEAIDLHYTGVTVSELADAETAWLGLLGLPGRRHLHVTDYLLDQCDDDELRALLATNAGHAGRHWQEWRLVAVLVGVVAIVAGLLRWPDLSGTAALLAVLAGLTALIVGNWWGRRIVFRADEAAAEAVGPETVANALQRYADLNDADYEWNRLVGTLRMQPSLPERLERLNGEPMGSESVMEDERPV